MDELLSDESTYVRVDKNPTKRITNELKTLLAKWHKNDYISTNTYRSLRLSDGVLPRAYGLPKIHKQNCPLRIIISSVNSLLHASAAFLHNILYLHLPRPKSYIKNSFELVKNLRDLYIEDNYKLLSLDLSYYLPTFRQS